MRIPARSNLILDVALALGLTHGLVLDLELADLLRDCVLLQASPLLGRLLAVGIGTGLALASSGRLLRRCSYVGEW
jgi:hypothetical protein